MEVSNRYRPKHRKILTYRLFFCVIFILFLLLLLFWASFFRIKTIVTVGIVELDNTNNLVSEHINGLNKFFFPKNNFFILDTDDIVQFLKDKNLGVATVKKNFPNTLSIIFPKREARFIICNTNNSCFYINEEGLLYSEVPQFSDYPLPLIMIAQNASSSSKSEYSIALGDKLTSTSTMRFLNIMTQKLPKLGINTKIIEISIGNDRYMPFDFKEIKIFTPQEWYIYLDAKMPPESVFSNIKLLFEQKIKEDRPKLQYIDMRFENKAFYMLY